MNIYETDKARLPSVVLPAWKKKKLQDYLSIYGITYSTFISEVIYELRVTLGTGTPLLANPHRDIKECVGKVIDRLTDRNELEGKESKPYYREPSAYWR